MASTEGLVPITRTFLAAFFDKYPFTPLSDDVARLKAEIRSYTADLKDQFPLSEGPQASVLKQAVDVYTSEFERFLTFISWSNGCKVSLPVDSINSYISWDSLAPGKMSMDIGFSVESTNSAGEKTMIYLTAAMSLTKVISAHVRRDSYTLIWDNSYSSFFKKVLRYKVDCIPPVVEPVEQVQSINESEG